MFDAIPVRVWLLVAIGAIAFGSAQYVYRHVAHAPRRRDITLPPEDLSWRTSAAYLRNLAILAAAIGLAIFIFTPAAERFAGSVWFLPGLLSGLGAAAIGSAWKGFASGRISPPMNGFGGDYERTTQPKRFWASLGWNMVLGCVLIWASLDAIEDPPLAIGDEKCVLPARGDQVERMLAVCNEIVRRRTDDAGAYMARGVVYLDLEAFDAAAADFDEALSLDPENHWALANRGVVHAWKKERVSAGKAFAVVRSVDPSNPVMLRGEAILKQEAGDTKGAIDRLSQSMVRDPDNVWAARTRSELYWELGDYERAAEDDARWLELKKRAAAPTPQPGST